MTILIEVQAETAPTEHFALLGPFGVYWQKYGLSPVRIGTVRIENFWPEPMGILLITIEKICRSCQSRRNSKEPPTFWKKPVPFSLVCDGAPGPRGVSKEQEEKINGKAEKPPFSNTLEKEQI